MNEKTILELGENINIHVEERFMCLEKTSVDFFSLSHDDKKGDYVMFYVNGNGDFDRAMEVSFYGIPRKGLYPEALEKFEKKLVDMVDSQKFQKDYTEYMNLYNEIGEKGINAGISKLDRFVNLEKGFLEDLETIRKEHVNEYSRTATKGSLLSKKTYRRKKLENENSGAER